MRYAPAESNLSPARLTCMNSMFSQSPEKPISEAFVHVVVKSTRFDSYSPHSGMRVGLFEADHAIPWELPAGTNALSSTEYRRPRRPVPPGLTSSLEKQALSYDEAVLLSGGVKKEDIASTAFKSVWSCPGPGLGVVTVCANFRHRGSPHGWQQLSYSMKESPIRMTTGARGASVSNQGELGTTTDREGVVYSFDQEDRHRRFWGYVRDKQWEAVASFIEKRAVLFNGDEVHRRRFRVMNLLAEMFESSEWLVTHTPFVFAAGRTKSVTICDTHFNDDQFADSSSEDEDGDGGEEYAEDSAADNDLTAKTPEPNNRGTMSFADEADRQPGSGREGRMSAIAEQHGDTNISLEGDTLLGNVHNGLVSGLGPVDDEISELSAEQWTGDGGESSRSENAKTEDNVKPEAVGDGDKDNKNDDADEDDSGDDSEDDDGGSSDRAVQQGFGGRPKAADLSLPKVIYTQETSGPRFDKLVRTLALQEAHRITQLHMTGASSASEIRHFTPRPQLVRHMKTLQERPDWIRSEDAASRFDSRTVDDLVMHLRADIAESRREKDFTSVRPVVCDMVKSGEFGPGVEEFTMPLPPAFPLLAGEAKSALRPALVEYERQLSKLRVEGLPKTLAEVHVPTTGEKLLRTYHAVLRTEEKRNFAMLASALEEEVRLYLLGERCYHAGRRESYIALPGMVPHNPNPLYTEPAVVIPTVDYDFAPGLLEPSAGKVVPPVGRKPTRDQLAEYQRIVEQINAERMQSIAAAAVARSTSFETGNLLTSRHTQPGAACADEPVSVAARKLPPGVYLHRRGSCPVAPGLQDFQSTLTSESVLGDNDQDTVNGRRAEGEGQISEREVAGLVRRFRVNGFELAHHGSVNDAVFSPSEARVATAGGDCLVKIWDPRDGSFVCRLKGHTNEVFAVRYSSSEQFLVSAAADAEILIWSLTSRTIARRLLGHVDVVYRSVSVRQLMQRGII